MKGISIVPKAAEIFMEFNLTLPGTPALLAIKNITKISLIGYRGKFLQYCKGKRGWENLAHKYSFTTNQSI
ncbi:MAG: hypothetical protein CVV44_01095 [Spirochaetae bacterium HGW-Spirochaetae-1]|jgi:hypothetical protein|nr:MAG: hypothetical protein CVV44_01095 [Spirochaetae bacterium HGW-Spirochaetae-1]